MATASHARIEGGKNAVPPQPPDSDGGAEGGESLKNGTASLDDSDDSTGSLLMKGRPPPPQQQHPREMAADFQDGGPRPPSGAPMEQGAAGPYPGEGRGRQDYPNYPGNPPEDFRASEAGGGYNHDVAYARGGGYSDQHGGQGNSSENSQTNKMYPQYGQRPGPGYPQGPRPMGQQPRGPGPTYPGGGNSQQQRFLSGQSLSQQTGPTPTLNQLLQAPNSMQRYHNNYEYGASQGMHKNMDPSVPQQYQGPNSSWGNMRGGSAYPQQMYRNQQGGSMPDPSMKRPYMSPGGMGSGPAAQGGQQYPQQYHPYSQTQSQSGPPVRPPVNQNYPQQGVQQYPGVQQHGQSQPSQMSPAGGYDHQRPPQMGSYGGSSAPPPQQPTSGQPQSTPSSQQPPPQQQQPQPQSQPQPNPTQQQQQSTSSQQQQLPPQHQSNIPIQQQPSQQPPQQQQPPPPQASQDGGAGAAEPPEGGAPGLRSLPTPPHPGVSPHRAAQSPSGSSAGSRSMSPALGQQSNIPMPPRPSSTQSESSGQAQMPQPTVAPQGYNQQMAPPSVYGNKMHQNMMDTAYSPQPASHYAQSGYHRPPASMGMHNYGNQGQNNYPGPSYPSQPQMPSHRMQSPHPGSAPSGYGPQYPSGNSPYPGSGGPPGPPGGYNMMPPPNQYPKSSSMPPPPTAAGAQAAAQAAVIAAAASSGGSPRQSPMYLRQHLQQKMYNSYGAGANGGQEGGMPPPPSTPASQPMGPGQMGNALSCDGPMPASIVPAGFTQTSAPTGMPPTTVTQSISSPVPSSVTVSSPSVMPPPAVLDEGSQASNASASSSLPEEPVRGETPKPKQQPPSMSHPPTPNTLPSPGAASMSSFHDEFESVSSPSWPRTPASPVINNQPYDHHPIKRPDGMLKLYDMSDDPDRRLFLDKLIMYQEERGTPLSQCPTISKQPLDLYRLYLATKERGGFLEVTKGKMWKEIAGLVGIGASSSAAYTLRKQYTKHLLPFECKFDRGGIDPGPLMNSLDSGNRKKNAKNQGPMMDGYPSPYPGGYPPNSPHPGMMPGSEYPGPGHHPPYQDMHHPGGMVNHSGSEGAMDPFSDEMQGSQYPSRSGSYGYSQSNSQYAGGQQPQNQQFGYSNTTGQQDQYGDQYNNSMAPSSSEGNYSNRMVADPYAPPPDGYPPNRTVGPQNSSQYPPYQAPIGEQDRFSEPQAAPQSPMIRPPAPSSSVIAPSPQPDPATPYPTHRYPSQPMGPRENIAPQNMGSYQGRPQMGPSQYPGNSQASGQSPYPSAQQDSYRGNEFQPQMSRLQSTLIQRLLPKNQTTQNYPQSQQGMYGQGMAPPNKVAPPSSIPGSMYQRDMYGMGPKRHGDYSKPPAPGYDHMGSYPPQSPYSDRSQYPYRPPHGVPPQSPGQPQQNWQRENRQYPPNQNQYPPGQRDNWDMSRHGDSSQPGGPGWSRYGPQQEPYPHHMGPKMMNRGYPPNKVAPYGGVGPPPQYSAQGQRKEFIFPPDSVEAVTPLITKRRRLLSKDVSPIDPWRIMMSLKSGLIGESTWALDVLSILVHDDATVLYFGLNHLQGLLEVLMDHFRRCLNLMFDLVGDMEVGFMLNPGEGVRKEKSKKWFQLDCDLPDVDEAGISNRENETSEERLKILDTTNYTYKTRCKKTVRTQDEEALFLFDPDKKWDVHEGFISGSSHWQHGGGEYTGYIQTQFENTEKRVRFCRILKDSEKKSEDLDRKGKVRARRGSDAACVKKECGSDTEEDESGLCLGSPKSSQDMSADIAISPEEAMSLSEKSLTSKAETTPKSESAKDETVEGANSEHLVNGESESNKENISELSVEVFPKIRPLSPSRKRRALEDLEDESYNRDEPSLSTMSDAQDSLARRCIAVSSILRNLSFVPGNDTEMSKHPGFLLVMGRLLLLNHCHSTRRPPQRHYDRDEETENTSIADSCSSLNSEHEWWWDMLHIVRENTLVTLANISGQLDLAPFPEEISFPILDGLMHWVTCPSSYAQDPLPTQPSHSVLSPQRLSLEALSKLSVLESNVDLMMATPPWERTDRLFALLSKWLSRNEDQVLREFSVVLLSNLSQADSAMARAIALQGTCIPLLITFVEQAEQSALQVANSQGINALRENPELMGTTLDMVRRAAGTLRCLARVPSNRTLFLQHQQRLLALVMSQILDQGVASIIADVLFECSQEDHLDQEEKVLPLAEEAAT